MLITGTYEDANVIVNKIRNVTLDDIERVGQQYLYDADMVNR